MTQQIRELAYNTAINEALHQAMDMSEDVMVMGQLVDYKSGIFGTTTGLAEKFGTNRVQDFPVAEATMTSVALGAAVAGARPVICHQRLDFALYSMDAIVNWLALWYFKSNGKSTAPVTIRAIIGKGWGQGPQHSKSLHAWFAHLPGLQVAMPSTAFDAKGLMLESIFGENPTVILEPRPLYSMKSHVPASAYRVRFGEAAIRKQGKDVTIVCFGTMVPSALRAALELSKQGVDAEVIDLRSLAPWDKTAVLESVAKTRRIVVAEPGWKSLGMAAEVITTVCESLGEKLRARPVRVTQPDSHTPMSRTLEETYYPNSVTLVNEIQKMLSH